MAQSPATKTALLGLIRRERRRLDDLLRDLTGAQMLEPALHGGWSVKDTLAHIAAWEQEFLSWYRAGQRGEIPDRPDFDNIDPFNRMLYERHRDRDLADAQAWSAQSYAEISAALEGMSEDELFQVGYYAWTGDAYPLAAYARANTDEHYAEHAAELSAWRSAP